jgi:anthranilate/para-aminobenzoate synthase component II
MAVRHQHLPITGVQFHPESVMTPAGMHLIENFLVLGGA